MFNANEKKLVYCGINNINLALSFVNIQFL